MHRSGLGALIIDCENGDLERHARFWSAALGLPIRASGSEDGARYVPLETARGRPHVELQAVAHPSRVHLDIKTDDVDAEVARLEQLGARQVERVRRWVVMEAPSGHRFCVVRLHPGEDVGPLESWSDEREDGGG